MHYQQPVTATKDCGCMQSSFVRGLINNDVKGLNKYIHLYSNKSNNENIVGTKKQLLSGRALERDVDSGQLDVTSGGSTRQRPLKVWQLLAFWQ